MRYIREHLFAKIMASYVLIILVGALVLVAAAVAITPKAYQRHMDMSNGMMYLGLNGRNQPSGDLALQRSQNMSNFRAGLMDAIGWSLLVSGAVAFATSIYFSRQILRPLEQLNRITRNIASGDYTARLDTTGGDEFSRVAASVNMMSDKLKDMEATRVRMIGDISHELRTPLTIISGYVEGLADGVVPADRNNFELIGREAARLTRLVNELQELSRVEGGSVALSLERIDLAALVTDLSAQMHPLFSEKQVGLSVEATETPVWVMADQDRLIQVFTNLINNALQYSNENTIVTVSLSVIDKNVVIKVIDQGIGLAEEDLSKVFERFYRVDRSRTRVAGAGSGIGLSIARALVEQHGGRITVSSEGLGKGTVFSVSLPLA